MDTISFWMRKDIAQTLVASCKYKEGQAQILLLALSYPILSFLHSQCCKHPPSIDFQKLFECVRALSREETHVLASLENIGWSVLEMESLLRQHITVEEVKQVSTLFERKYDYQRGEMMTNILKAIRAETPEETIKRAIKMVEKFGWPMDVAFTKGCLLEKDAEALFANIKNIFGVPEANKLVRHFMDHLPELFQCLRDAYTEKEIRCQVEELRKKFQKSELL